MGIYISLLERENAQETASRSEIEDQLLLQTQQNATLMARIKELSDLKNARKQERRFKLADNMLQQVHVVAVPASPSFASSVTTNVSTAFSHMSEGSVGEHFSAKDHVESFQMADWTLPPSVSQDGGVCIDSSLPFAEDFDQIVDVLDSPISLFSKDSLTGFEDIMYGESPAPCSRQQQVGEFIFPLA